MVVLGVAAGGVQLLPLIEVIAVNFARGQLVSTGARMGVAESAGAHLLFAGCFWQPQSPCLV